MTYQSFGDDWLSVELGDRGGDAQFSTDHLGVDLATALNPPPASEIIIRHRRTESHPARPSSSLLSEFVVNFDDLPVTRSQQRPFFDADTEFRIACADSSFMFNPRELGFLPLLWPDRQQTFGHLVEEFFRKKGSANTRFLHKLYNALRISALDRSYFNLVGVAWLTDHILKVHKLAFARLLGIKTIDGSFFHKQGNFPSHGFVEIAAPDARATLSPDQLEGVDFDIVRLFVHESHDFFRGCGPEIQKKCAWFNFRRKTDEQPTEP